MKILAGVHTEYTGEILLNGLNIKPKSPHDATSYGISVIHQEMSSVNSMTVADNIFLGREKARLNLWMDYRSQQSRAKQLLDQLEIDVNLSQTLGDYPVSIRQMVEIAKALVFESKIIVMDEPTSTLNNLEVDRLFKIIEDLKQRECGIIYISHRLEEIYAIGDRISVLRDGKYIGTSDASDLPQDKLIQWMVGRTISQQFPSRTPDSGPKKILRVRDFSLADPSGAKPWAAEKITFDLHHGEILGIAGLQGSGKSELLNGLFGTFGRIDEGEIHLGSEAFKVRSPRHSIEQGLVLLTNDRKRTGLIPSMNVAYNLSLAALKSISPWGLMNKQKEWDTAKQDIKEFDIKAFSPDQEVQTLSGGNQQKVVLAKWLRTQPIVLLLDEPTIGVDVGAKHEIYELMNRWTSMRIAILLITSELPELLAMSDRILVMHRGRISAEFTKGQATQENVTQAAMGKGADH
jgi:ABC-type sugar transport system ATPase subunit